MNSLKDKSVLVTGGAGFIGSNIVEHLLTLDVQRVVVLDNLSTGSINNISGFIKQDPRLEFIYGDISNLEICRRAVQGINLICHQAALGSVPRSMKDPLLYHNSNVTGFLNILVAAEENKIKRVVYASSSSVYGDNKTLPKQEERTGKVLSPYAATKHIDEVYATLFTDCYGMECIGLRYFNVFGKRQNPDGAYAAVIPKFIEQIRKGESPVINGDGTYSRDFTHVDNAVLGNLLALTTENPGCFGRVFNIGAGGRTSILDLFEMIRDQLGSDVHPVFGPIRQGDIPHSNACIDKAEEFFGYQPKTSFRDGIAKTVQYYLDNIS